MRKQLGLCVIHFNIALRKENKSQVFENKVLRKTSGAKRDEESRKQDAIT
jgi:hypothetical protein